MLLIGLCPIAKSLSLNQSGLSFTVMPLIVSPEYLGQASVFSIITSIPPSFLSTANSSTEGLVNLKGLSACLSHAARSLATP